MKLLNIPMGFLVVAAVHGGPAEQAIVAAMRLSEQSSYSWVTTITDDARTYDLEGRTQKGGYTWMRFPMIKSIGLRLGREHDNEIEAVFMGSALPVIRTENGWKTLAELPRARRDWDEEPYFWPAPPPPIMPIGTGRGRGGFAVVDPLDPPPIVMAWPVPRKDDEEHRAYSNLQLAPNHPHDELAVIVSSYTDLQVNGDVAAGTLSDVGSRLLLVQDGQENKVRPLCAAGTFKLLMKDGLVVKYLLRLEGILLVDRKKVLVHQTSSTIVKDIGTSGFDVTDEIKRKLGQ